MPKKRQHLRSFKPFSPASPSASASTSNSTDKASANRSVNDLLANLRRTSAATGPSSSSSHDLPAATPSVPPAIREILQIPETPPPRPRRPVRARYDDSGRRLPAGPPPPRSWVRSQTDQEASSIRKPDANLSFSDQEALPGVYLPARGSLIDIVLRNVALDWELHRVYNQYYVYFIPNHLKPALIRLLRLSDGGVTAADLKLILLPPVDAYDDGIDSEELEEVASSVHEVTHLDLSGSVGWSIKIKEVTDLLFPARKDVGSEEPQDSWDAAAETTPAIPRALLPNLTHLSLALDMSGRSQGSWKQLLALSSKASNITHLSLAFWPEPCLTPNARYSSVQSPQGGRIAYSGTGPYSHSLDRDWSEAILVLRRLCRNFYELEYLDLTGCARWFHALMAESDHDRVDWTGSWGKISELKLYNGWTLAEDAMPSEQAAFAEAMETAARVEKHIRAMRAGKGRFINVERDRLPV